MRLSQFTVELKSQSKFKAAAICISYVTKIISPWPSVEQNGSLTDPQPATTAFPSGWMKSEFSFGIQIGEICWASNWSGEANSKMARSL